jgi:hypothetical protein
MMVGFEFGWAVARRASRAVRLLKMTRRGF